MERVIRQPGATSATVVFTSVNACDDFWKGTANGIELNLMMITTEKDASPDNFPMPPPKASRENATRCIEFYVVNESLSLRQIKDAVMEKNDDWQLENLILRSDRASKVSSSLVEPPGMLRAIRKHAKIDCFFDSATHSRVPILQHP